MKDNFYPSVIGIFGHRGYGKSTLCLEILKNAPVKSIILDRVNTFDRGITISNIVFNDNSILLLREFLECNEAKMFIYKPISRKELSYFYNLIPLIENCIIGIDEIALEGNSKGFYNDNLHDLIHFGRHKNLGFIGTSQRIRNIPHSFISQCDIIFSFAQTDLNDRTFLAGHLNADELINLEMFKYLSFPINQNIKICFKKGRKN